MLTQEVDAKPNEAYFTAKDFTIEGVTDKFSVLFYLGFSKAEEESSATLRYLHRIAELTILRISQQPELEIMRHVIEVDLSHEDLESLMNTIPFVNGMEYVDETWLYHVWESLVEVFKEEIKGYEGTVASYFMEHHAQVQVVGKIFFHLVENTDPAYPFAFMATYSTKPTKSKKAIHTPLKNALEEFKGDQKKLLSLISTVVQAAEKSVFISELLESGELFAPIRLTQEEAYKILTEITLYEEAGILCRVPDWWRRNSNRIGLSVTVGEKEPSKVGLEGMMDFHPKLTIDGEPITQEELQHFLEMAEGITLYKGKWVEINKKKLDAALLAFEKVQALSNTEGLTLAEVMRLELQANQLVEELSQEVEIQISNGQWLKEMKTFLEHPETIEKSPIEPSFCAKLRGYQENGYQWLNKMASSGFGACLADDMGLGKTVQMIAFLERKRVHQGGKVLLVLPASLIGNWCKEVDKFAPEMPYQILHSSSLTGTKTLEIKVEAFLYITTYGMASKLEMINEIQWDCLILDEAQAIKNPGTKQTKAIKAIPSKTRIALTGTPIENRLSDLWSLFDFLNQGMLGTSKEFNEFNKGLKDHPEGYMRLRKMIQPFMLRRLKTDRSIIADLPDKMEMNTYTTLSKKQIALYKQLLQEIKISLQDADGIQRKGLILSSIMKFKQICNHPDQYMAREDYKIEHSGKFEQLRDICETIHEKRERVLVFTQFREMTEPIADLLSQVFGKSGFVLHGGTSVKKRSEMVEAFNGESYIPFMVLSLKAGGVGLNLTSANHVIHFDRWWNPAVENQATDRAFRIGQTKNVLVYKFVTQGTIEEKINAIIEDKVKLSGELLGSTGESWITEYSNQELMKLFALGGESA